MLLPSFFIIFHQYFDTVTVPHYQKTPTEICNMNAVLWLLKHI